MTIIGKLYYKINGELYKFFTHIPIKNSNYSTIIFKNTDKVLLIQNGVFFNRLPESTDERIIKEPTGKVELLTPQRV